MYEKYCVLFVDDEINILNSLRRGMMDEEFKCRFANSGKEALEIIEEEKISVIVTDMRMPEMNGLELLKIVEEKSPLTVKIVLSGYTQIPQILATINQVDIFKFIGKPWELDDLIKMIKKGLDYYIIKEDSENNKKILEAQNKAYQNILKRIDTVIANAKKSNELLVACGKEILNFGSDFSAQEHERYAGLFKIKGEIFEIFGKAISNEKKDVLTKNLSEIVLSAVSLAFPEAKMEVKGNFDAKVHADVKMVEASALVCMALFHDEFKEHGLFGNIEGNSQFKFSFICPNIEKPNDEKSVKSLLDIKLDFANTVFAAIFPFCDIGFKIAKINGNLVIGFAMEETNKDIQ